MQKVTDNSKIHVSSYSPINRFKFIQHFNQIDEKRSIFGNVPDGNA
jgi:hypothetical protein